MEELTKKQLETELTPIWYIKNWASIILPADVKKEEDRQKVKLVLRSVKQGDEKSILEALKVVEQLITDESVKESISRHLNKCLDKIEGN